MKKLSVILLLAIGMGLFLFHSCQKEQGNKTSSEIQNNSDDDAMVRQIIAFKNNCDYLLNNPNIKTGGSISVDSAVFYISATMNYMYAFNVYISDLRIDTSLLIFTVNQNGTVQNQTVAELLQKVTDSVRVHYQMAPFQNKKLTAVSIDYYINNYTYILQVVSLTGNTFRSKSYPDNNYWEGRDRGSCDYTILETDAPHEIQKEIDELYREYPPQGYSFCWLDPQIVIHDPDNNTIDNYRNENDDPIKDNVFDYLIFYMDQQIVENYEDPHCMLDTYEIPFYQDQYLGFLTQALSSGSNYRYKESVITGSIAFYEEGENSYDYMVHYLEFTVGRWFLCTTDPNYPIGID